MNLTQKLRRLSQQGGFGWNQSIDVQYSHLKILKRLYENNGLTLELTCNACPEQYNVLKNGEMVAYFRLRHGEFTVNVPDVCGDEILSEYPDGDGIFEDTERFAYMSLALRKIQSL